MKRILFVMSFVVIVLLLTGCGHNIGTAFNGKVFNVGYDPQLNKFGVQFYDGVMVTGLQKEKSETNFSYTESLEKDGIKTSSALNYSQKAADQMTGYGVDAIKARGKFGNQ